MANTMYQSVIHQMKNVVDRVCGVVDSAANIVACSDNNMIHSTLESVLDYDITTTEPMAIDGYTFKHFGSYNTAVYYAFVKGEDELASKCAGMLAISFGELRRCFDERFDKTSFLKNLLFDNVLPGELYTKSRELLFNAETDRAVLLVRTNGDTEIITSEILSLFCGGETNKQDYVIGINETDAVLIKEVKAKNAAKELDKIANEIIDVFNTQHYTCCSVGIGSIAHNIKDLPRAYKEAQVALEVGKVFENDKRILSYENLGIGRLIYQLPTTLCQMFIDEVFKGGSIYLLDSETLLTIQKFFENNLNVSETARKLFVHRNTLVYRLEKIKKLTGLDIREFDNAITFKVAIMVSRYLANNNGGF